jgi:hypothetical protein
MPFTRGEAPTPTTAVVAVPTTKVAGAPTTKKVARRSLARQRREAQKSQTAVQQSPD